MDGVAFHDPMHEATKKPLTTVAACHCSPYSPGRQSRPHLFHVVRKVCTKSGHVSTIPSAVKNNSHHGIATIKSDYPSFFYSGGSTWRSWVQRWTFVLPSRYYEELCTEANDSREEEHDRHQPDGESICSCLFWRWLLVYCCRIVRRIDGRQRCLRCCD